MSQFRRTVLALYRDLLKYGQELEFTDSSYFYKRVRDEFLKYKDTQDVKAIERLIKKGEACLKRRRVV